MWSPDDYPMLCEWWQGHGWGAVPLKVLPPLGVILDNTAAGWLYMDNGGTGVAMLEWLVTNPKASPLRSARCISKVVEFLKSEAKRMDYGAILTTCRQPSLARLLARNGFVKTDENLLHMMGVC